MWSGTRPQAREVLLMCEPVRVSIPVRVRMRVLCSTGNIVKELTGLLRYWPNHKKLNCKIIFVPLSKIICILIQIKIIFVILDMLLFLFTIFVHLCKVILSYCMHACFYLCLRHFGYWCNFRIYFSYCTIHFYLWSRYLHRLFTFWGHCTHLLHICLKTV